MSLRERPVDGISQANAAGNGRVPIFDLQSLCSCRRRLSKQSATLAEHRKSRTKDENTLRLIADAIRNDRVCAHFQDAEAETIQTITDTMEYFEFSAGEAVVQQGDAGLHFFVTDHGALDVIKDGTLVNSIRAGQAFGALALLCSCPRTASVVAKVATGVWAVDANTFMQALQDVAASNLGQILSRSSFSNFSASPTRSVSQVSTDDFAVSSDASLKRTASQSSLDEPLASIKRVASAEAQQQNDTALEGWAAADAEQQFCFVRHAEALHNVHESNLWTPDNPLTRHGEKQCRQAREQWGKKIFDDAELIIVSPMTRTLMTAYLINGGCCDDRWLISAMCAESLSGATCDEGTPKSEQAASLPWIQDVQGFDKLEERWWLAERDEEELRVSAFFEFLQRRQEKKIVVVSHGHFLEYATGDYLQNAQHHLMSSQVSSTMKQRLRNPTFNFNNALNKEYETKPLRSIVKAPLSCLKGIGRKKCAAIARAGPKTVRDLACWKYANWAEALCILESTEQDGARNFAHMAQKMNINKAIIAEWEGKSASQLLDAPLHAFEGLTEGHDDIFKVIGIKNIRDLGTWKYYAWARAVCALAKAESADGSS